MKKIKHEKTPFYREFFFDLNVRFILELTFKSAARLFKMGTCYFIVQIVDL